MLIGVLTRECLASEADQGIEAARVVAVLDRLAEIRGAPKRICMESFLSLLKTERTARKTYRTRDRAKTELFDHIELFCAPRRRHSTLGPLSPVEFVKE